MPANPLRSEQVVKRGRQIYERDLRAKVEKQHQGKFAVIDVASGDYEIDGDSVKADQRLRKRHPRSLFYLLRIGYPAAFRLGGSIKVQEK